MIYGSFAICSGYWTSYAIIFSIWTVLFTINMYLKDEMSYKHKEGWEVYKNNSYMLLPKLLPTNILNYAFYATVTAAVYVHYHKDTLLA